MSLDIDTFIAACRKSSNDAYVQFKQLLEQLEQPNTRQAARCLLTELKVIDNDIDQHHFQFVGEQVLDRHDELVELQLLQFPSTFEPEAWSKTFYEGLIRYPADEFADLNIIELGCGIGWISLALALRCNVNKIFGLDINPKAITCAKLNLYLLALNDEGTLTDKGEALLSAVEFHQSDLCDVFAAKANQFDRIIGCIPQVLNPEPEVMDTLIAESASDDYLQSLSNYTALQGYVEDQFGLGLIARALEQSISLLKGNGKVILNLGGRPGRGVLETMMTRRGFKVRRIWHSQVKQAEDTDIQSLVAIERACGHRFEFYMSSTSDLAIDARTASAYQQKQGSIFHSVVVYEAKLCFAQQVKAIYGELDRLKCKSLSSAVDLSYEHVDSGEERHSFLAFLCRWLGEQTDFGYEDTQGLQYLRQQLVEYLGYYHKVNYAEKDVLITPGRSELLNNLIMAYRPALTLIDRSLRHLIRENLDNEQYPIIEAPSNTELLQLLIDKLQPQLVITQLSAEQAYSPQTVKSLVDSADKAGTFLLIDMTEITYLSSEPTSHGVYRFIAEQSHPDNLMLFCELINNRVYPDCSINFALSRNATVNQTLVNIAELSYSRTPVMSQLYYGHLLEELLYFQRTRHQPQSESTTNKNRSRSLLKLTKHTTKVLCHPAIVGANLPFTPSSVRLDYGENALASPQLLKNSVLESYITGHIAPKASSVHKPLREMLEKRFGLSRSLHAKMAFFNGMAPLFELLMQLCAEEGKTMLFATGCYGYFTATTAYHRIATVILPGSEQQDFKITPDALRAALQQNPGSWLFLNAPIVNPTGAVYSQAQLHELLVIAAQYQATVILDTIFCGLEFSQAYYWHLKDNVEDFNRSLTARFILLGGLSKEFAAGGLRFAYAWSNAAELMSKLAALQPREPHPTLLYAVKKLYKAQNQQEPTLLAHLQRQKDELTQRAQRLTAVLSNNGWQVLQPKGGLFLVAKPLKFIQEQGIDDTQAADQICEKLFEQCNLAINNATWTGLPGYCRFVLSVNQQEFEEGLQRLAKFKL